MLSREHIAFIQVEVLISVYNSWGRIMQAEDAGIIFIIIFIIIFMYCSEFETRSQSDTVHWLCPLGQGLDSWKFDVILW